MDAVRPDTERIVNAFGLSVKLVDIEWPNTSRHISVGSVRDTQPKKNILKTFVCFFEDHEMNKSTFPIPFVPYQDIPRHV